MTNQDLLPKRPHQSSSAADSDRQTIGGFAPSTIVLVVAFTCFLGLIWGVIDDNWVLVATETPSVLALLGVWAFARAHQSGRRVAIIAAAIGALCAVELWIATVVFDARGMALAIIVAASSGITVALGGIWAIWSNHKQNHAPQEQASDPLVKSR